MFHTVYLLVSLTSLSSSLSCCLIFSVRGYFFANPSKMPTYMPFVRIQKPDFALKCWFSHIYVSILNLDKQGILVCPNVCFSINKTHKNNYMLNLILFYSTLSPSSMCLSDPWYIHCCHQIASEIVHFQYIISVLTPIPSSYFIPLPIPAFYFTLHLSLLQSPPLCLSP